MKVVINRCWGGFDLSDKAMAMFKALGGNNADSDRDNPILVKVVETLGEEANTEYSSLKVVEIPDGVDYYIDDYDGMETIEECHRSWC
jgi:hypothetical protein